MEKDMRTVVLVDSNRKNPSYAQIPDGIIGPKITVDGVDYLHIRTDASGVWTLAPMIWPTERKA